MREELGRLAEVVAGVERCDVGLVDLGLTAELLLQPPERDVDRTPVHPRDQSEGEHVLRPFGLLLADAEALDGPNGDRRHRHRVDLVAVQRPIGGRVRRVARLLEVALGERILVDDDRAPARHLVQVGSERRRVHGHRDVCVVPRGGDVARSRTGSGRRIPRGPCRPAPGSRPGSPASVARSLPRTAVAFVNRSPVSCMPSPESPAKRMTTWSRSSTVLLIEPVGREAIRSFGLRTGLRFGI